MAVVGKASVIIEAVTDGFEKDLKKKLNALGGDAEKSGAQVGESFSRGFSRGGGSNRNIFAEVFGGGNFIQEADRARVAFRNFNRVFTLAFPAIVGVGGAIGALGGGLVTLIALLGNAARSGIVLVAALGALGQAGLATSIATKGVAEALQAGRSAQNAAAGSARNEEAALRRLRDARIELRNLIQTEKPEALIQARERAADAADTAADAARGAERAERTYFEAQRSALRAQEDLNDAREEAVERIQQLRFEVEGAAISEQRARIQFERTRESLQRVQDLPPNSRARQEAELAFASADLNLRRAIDRNSDLKKEETASSRAGIEGADSVSNAKDRLANAQQAETDSAIDAARAFQDLAKAQLAAARAAEDAQSGGRVEQELDARIARAREAVEDAEKALADAAGGGVDAFRKALERLSPAARLFVTTIIANDKAFNDFKKTVQEPFFQEFNRSLFLLLDRLPALGDLFAGTSRIVGGLASGFVDLFLGAENFDRTQRVWKTNDKLLANLGATFLNLVEGLLLLLDAAEPIIDAFGEWARQSSSGWVKGLKEDFEGVRDGLEQSAEKASRLFGIFGTIGEIFGVIGGSINEAGGAADFFLGWLEELTDNGLKGLQDQAASGELKQFFLDATESAVVVLEILGDIILGLLKLGAAPGTKQFLDSIRNATKNFSGLNEAGVSFADSFGAENGPLAAIGRFIEELFRNFGLLLENESFTIFIDTLTDALSGLNDFLEKETTQAFLEAVAPILAWLLALGFIGSIISGLFKIVSGFFLLFVGGPKVAGFAAQELFSIFKVGGMSALKPILILGGKILLIVGLVIAAIVLMWQNSETFRTAVAGIFSAIGEAFSGVMEDLKAVFGEGTAGGEKIAQVFEFLGDTVGLVLGVVAVVLGNIIGVIGGVLQFIGGIFTAIGFLFDFIANIFKAVFALITGDFDKVGEYLNKAILSIRLMFLSIGLGIGNFFISVVNGIIDGWNGFVSKIKFPDWPIFGSLAGQSADFMRINRVPMLSLPSRLAEGGTVLPRAGGQLAIIGEAGQAERVEPLDPDGLSKRDKAMITMLSGGGSTINVYPSQGMNETELARKISREMASQMRRGGV